MNKETPKKPIASFQSDPELARRAGARGGAIVKERYGSEFFRRIGAAGGQKTAASQGREHMAAIGRLGGRGGRGKPKGTAASE